MKQSRVLFRGAIVLYFVIGMEILIMISPAAGFFYGAFNPFLLSLARTPATRWLTAFFLPHMVSPPNALLMAIRVAGSALFVLGAVMFLGCAGQVYYHKFARKGVALRGLYSFVRHPQYLALALAGLGLSILWPRFLVVALWSVMVAIYYLLALDEERRMIAQFGDGYREYRQGTGMFLPRAMEAGVVKILPFQRSSLRAAAVLVLLAGATIGGAFALRVYTVSRLPLWSVGPVTALAIQPADRMTLDHRMASVLELPAVRERLDAQAGPFLVYFLPKDYIMQGMIADTGGEWQLYKRHHTLAMISDWIFHPFRHLEGGHTAMHHGMNAADPGHGRQSSTLRRLIFVRIQTVDGRADLLSLFGINVRRTPLFVADVDVHDLALEGVRDLPAETGWGRVPTPMF